MPGVVFDRRWLLVAITNGVLLLDPGLCRSEIPARPLPAKEVVVAALRQRERLVRTASCVIVVEQTPTSKDAIPRIRAICKARGDFKGGDSFIITDEIARQTNRIVLWRGDGILERYETYATLGDLAKGSTAAIGVNAFDGQVVRSLSTGGKQPIGTVNSPKQSHWDQGDNGGYSLIYKYRTSYISDLLEKSSVFERFYNDVDGATTLTVVFVHPEFKNHMFELVFDDRFRLLKRSYIIQVKNYDPAPRLYEMDEIGDYKAYKDKDGVVIDFPQRSAWHYFAGVDPETQSPVEYTCRTMQIRDPQFNTEMPHEMFTLDFPANARVYDGLTGAGWIGGPPEPDAPTVGATAKRSLLTWFIIGNLVFLGIVLTAFIVQRRRMTPGNRI